MFESFTKKKAHDTYSIFQPTCIWDADQYYFY